MILSIANILINLRITWINLKLFFESIQNFCTVKCRFHYHHKENAVFISVYKLSTTIFLLYKNNNFGSLTKYQDLNNSIQIFKPEFK